MARLLLRIGADPTAPNDLGETPLVLACKRGEPRLLGLLLSKHAPTETRTRA